MKQEETNIRAGSIAPPSKEKERPRRALKPDAQAFDEVRIKTVPRFKDSRLSGSEWRISTIIEFYRNGNVIHTEQGWRNVKDTCGFLPFAYARASDDGHACFAGEENYCDQEGCSEQAVSSFILKEKRCGTCGSKEQQYRQRYRKFCAKHSRRGDQSLDDRDSNYIKVDIGLRDN